MGQNGKVLIVEDEYLIALEIKVRLEKFGYKVQTIISSGEDALKWLSSGGEADIILMDINLTGKLNGIETASIIDLKYNRPVIYITAYSDDKTLEEAKITNAYGFVKKPIDGESLRLNMEMALGRFQKINDEQQNTKIFSAVSKLNQQSKKISVWHDDEMLLLDPADIYYLEIDKGLISFRLKTNRYYQRGTLTEWANKLAPYNFYRCHKNYLVNLNKISKITLDFDNSYILRLEDISEFIPVARKKSSSIMRLLQL